MMQECLTLAGKCLRAIGLRAGAPLPLEATIKASFHRKAERRYMYMHMHSAKNWLGQVQANLHIGFFTP